MAGLSQLHPQHVYVADAAVLNGVPATVLAEGAKIELGNDDKGAKVTLEASLFHSDGIENLSLVLPDNRVLFGGNVFERQKEPVVMRGDPAPTPEQDKAARLAWLTKVKGRFDVVYLSTNTRWNSDPEWLANLVSPPPGSVSQGR